MIKLKYALAMVYLVLASIWAVMLWDMVFGVSKEVLGYLLFTPSLMMAIMVLSDAVGLPKPPGPSDSDDA